jgi:hypothetical protein
MVDDLAAALFTLLVIALIQKMISIWARWTTLKH